MNERTEILTPVARLVAGSCYIGQDKDAEGRPLVIKNGPNAGQPRVDYYLGLAIKKDNPQWPAFEATIRQKAREAFPQFFDAAGNCLNPKFAFKISDGDSIVPNARGSRNCDKEGYPGHWIVSMSSGFAPKCYTSGGASVLTEPDAIKRGYYVRVYGSVGGNGSLQQPGVFLNHSLVELVGYGQEIFSGPDGAVAFSSASNYVPQGMSQVPPAPTATVYQPQQAAAPYQPQQAAAPYQPQQAAAQYQPQQAAAVTPAPDFLSGPKLLLNGVAYPKADLLAQGWPADVLDALPLA